MGSRRRTRERSSIGSTLLLVAALAGLGAVGLYAVGRLGLPALADGRIPAVGYDAYRAASDAAPTVAPGCSVDWTVLAGISQVEARHGRMDEDHQLAPNGDVLPEIRGAALDGTQGMEPVPDTDGGELDGDPSWDRAMGPLQFIPTTWAELGRDGNGDGVADPDNLYDAALTAAAHLCVRDPGNYSDRAALRRALVGYNASGRYAEEVLGWIERYRSEPLSEIIESPDPDRPG
ncbi:MAG: lytic murein transglycosylase [Chloroflexota bacterium]